MKENKYKATWLLVLVSCSFFVSYPFHHTFWGGLFSGGFGAAMVGGLADWFAVTALFRRPLGIPYRTAIIPRNRERIFHALATMVEQELLMKENIKRRLQEQDVAGMVIRAASGTEGRNMVKRMLYQFIRGMLAQVRTEDVKGMLDQILKVTIKDVKIAPHIMEGGQWLLSQGYDKKIVNILADCLISLTKHQQVKAWLAKWFAAAIRQYEGDKNRRAFFDMLIDISPEEVAEIGQKRILSFLEKIKDAEHPLKRKICLWLSEWLQEKQRDELFLQQIENWKESFVDSTAFAQLIAPRLAAFCGQAAQDSRTSVRWLDGVVQFVNRRLDEIAADAGQKAAADDFLKKTIGRLIDAHHEEIGRTVLRSLSTFSNEMLVEFVENKAGNDLQMIRINGSVVGGLVGIALYLATYWI
jgi:uncharacterized membrane-anchored protein YjiN (DUF445 family)